ncbi:MAG: hypothetical protein XU14_C0025G0013 [Armatimonadetes bacterium CSP1-3]|nr:MAG: hypothetical protein XU14_C0025G0013 [Armatimonadetes bacterium CSP1-3]
MSRVSMIVLVGLALVGLIVVVNAGVKIVVAQFRAPASAAVAPAPAPAGQDSAPAAVALTPNALLVRELIRSVMPAIISIVLLIPSTVAALSRNRPPEHQRWATAAISSIITYWLR